MSSARRADSQSQAAPVAALAQSSRIPWLTLLVSLMGVCAASATSLMLYRQHQAMERQIALMEKQNQDFTDANRAAIDIARGTDKVKQGNALVAEGKALIREGRGLMSKRAAAGGASRVTASRDARASVTPPSGSVVETSLRRYQVQLTGTWTEDERRQLLRQWAAACGIDAGAIVRIAGGYEFQSRGCAAGTFDNLRKK